MKKRFFLLPLIISAMTTSNSLAGGLDECQRLSDFLSERGCEVERLPIVQGGKDEFPFNIMTEVIRKEKGAEDLEGGLSEETPEARDTLVLAFRVEDAAENMDFFTELINGIRGAAENQAEPCKVALLFTYGDSQGLPAITGTEAFVLQIADAERMSAICVIPASKKSAVIPGGGGESSPSWLVKAIADAFYSSDVPYSMKGGVVSSLYQHNMLQNDFRTALFLKNKIAAAGVELSILSEPQGGMRRESVMKAAAAFSRIAASYRPSETSEWDRHTNQLSIGGRTFWIHERETTAAFIIVAFISLFVLCEFSFVFPFKKKDARTDVGRLWYLIPLTALATACAFFAGQKIAAALAASMAADFYFEIAMKLLFGFVIISFAFIMIIKIQGALEEGAYSYLLSVAGIMNIFLFSAMDISLFYLFSAEYIIIACSRPARRTPTLAVLFVVMAAPFIPYAANLVMYIEPSFLEKFVQSAFLANLLSAFAFMPFEIMWLRILARLNRMWEDADIRTKKFMRQNLLAIGGSVAIFSALLAATLRLIPKEYRPKARRQSPPPAVEMQDDIAMTLFSYDSKFFGETERTVTLRMQRQPQACVIEILGDGSNSVLHSDISRTADKSASSDTFRFPLRPPKDITLRFIADDSKDATITARAYFLDGENQGGVQEPLRLAQKSIAIPGANPKAKPEEGI